MFNLTESFKKEYELFLVEEEEKENKDFFFSLREAQKEAEDGFALIESYFSAINEENNENKIDVKNENKIDVKKTIALLSRLSSPSEEVSNYSPTPTFEIVKTIGDLKFPKNIIFFIKQLLSWIKNVVIYFFKKFTNFARKLLGMKEEELDKDVIKLRNLIQKVEKKESIDFFPLKNQKTKTIRAYNLGAENFRDFESQINNIFEGENAKENGIILKEFQGSSAANQFANKPSTTNVIVSIDLSNDLLSLQELLQHFFDLFDNSYGSNNEYLFGVDDLKLFLTLFKQSFSDLSSGRMPTYEIGGVTSEAEMIDANRIKDNLIRTNLNVTQLKDAFVKTGDKLEDIARIVANKQLIGATNMGVSYKFYSGATYELMLSLIEKLKPRLKEAKTLENSLKKMQESYTKITKELEKLSSAMLVSPYSSITYTSVYQRKISNLVLSAKYMTQTVVLRLSTLSIYIKEISDILEIIRNLNAINSVDRTIAEKTGSWFSRRILKQ